MIKYNINHDNFKVRKEENGNYSFLNKTSLKIVFLNKTASEIFNNENIKNSSDLIKYFKNKFPEVDDSQIESDCINILYKMNALDIIEIIESDESNNAEIRVAGESDYKKISKFVKECLKSNSLLLCSSIDLNHYSAYAIRVRQFNNSEFNYLHFDKNGIIDAMITLSVVGSTSSYAITDIFVKNDEQKIIEQILKYIFHITPSLAKIRIMIRDNKESSKLIGVFEKLKFEKEAVLKKEYNNIDLLVYSLFRRGEYDSTNRDNS